MQLNPKAFGLSMAILSGVCWFVSMVFSLLTGIGKITMTTIGAFHPFFTYSWAGMIIVTVEELVAGFILGWIFAWLYNWLYNKFLK